MPSKRRAKAAEEPTPKGRRPLLETCPELGRFLVEAVSKGSTLTAACDVAGIDDTAAHGWVRMGEKPKAREVYRQFSIRLKEAARRRYLAALGNIETQARRQWQADGWLLERTMPQHYGRESLRQELAEISKQIAEINKAMAANGQPGRIKDMLGASDDLNEDEGGE